MNAIAEVIAATTNAMVPHAGAEIPAKNIEDVYVFNWNRDYPADKYFTLDLKLNGFKRVKKEEFTGCSHKRITLEIYKKV